jgi:hypothetical protein
MNKVLAVGLLAQLAATASFGLTKLENLVTFGDSYTDEGRLGYFINNDGKAPPAGTLLPESNSTASGGYAWGRIIAQKTGARYFDYAVSGGTCSNKIVERDFPPIRAPFPSVLEYGIPAYKADTAFEALYGNRKADNTVYALWIGTNDLGAGAFLTDSNAPGTSLTSFVDCVWEVFDNLYATGGRRFVLLNEAPLEHSPMYNVPALGGTMDSQFWGNKSAYNMTETKYKIMEYTTSVNTMFEYGAAYQTVLKKRWPEAAFAVFDVHSLMMDIINKPGEYLSAPANVTGYYRVCDPKGNAGCVDSKQPMDSFMW